MQRILGSFQLDFGGWLDPTRYSATEEALRQARKHAEETQLRVVEAHSAIVRSELPEPLLITAAELEANHPQGGTVWLRVTYLVPCAVWRPAYRATLAPGEQGETVTLECEAVVWQHTEEDWKDVELLFSTARPTLGASPPRLVEDWLRLRDKSEQEKHSVEVSIREEAIPTTGEGGASKTEAMPGLDDGGEALTQGACRPCWVGRLGRRVPEEGCTASPPARRTALAAPLLNLPRPLRSRPLPQQCPHPSYTPPDLVQIWSDKSRFGPPRRSAPPREERVRLKATGNLY